MLIQAIYRFLQIFIVSYLKITMIQFIGYMDYTRLPHRSFRTKTISSLNRDYPLLISQKNIQLSSTNELDRWANLSRVKTFKSNQKNIGITCNNKRQYEIKLQGNNSELIERLLIERGNWTKATSNRQKVQLIWGYLPTITTLRFDRTQMVSRIVGSQKLTDKGRLYSSLTDFCSRNSIQLSFIPITFFFDQNSDDLSHNISQFINFFIHIQENTTLSNTWIFKPTNLNQGRQIFLFNNFQKLKKLVSFPTRHHSTIKYRNERTASSQRNQSPPTSQKMIPNKEAKNIINFKIGKIDFKRQRQQDLSSMISQYVKHFRSIIIQKYIELPLLIQKRKFDIRIWVLMDHYGKYYMFEQGYLRFSSEFYQLDHKTINNNFVHLTNHSLQKHSQNYSKSQNLKRMQTLRDQLQMMGKSDYYPRIIKEMIRIIKISINACLANTQREEVRCRCFEIFGYDFLLDRDLNVKLIQANCNPAITQDCSFLSQMIPKMINDAFKLTVDKHFNCHNPKNYVVEGLSLLNSWILLGRVGQFQIDELRKQK